MSDEDKKTYCMICGDIVPDGKSICPICKEKIEKESRKGKEKVKKEAEIEIKRQGIPPEKP
ncbi:MAG: hypothetical protein HY730_05525 [Candidatus Tectomicrobia bacterium]|uniref:Uncharacterized protein n=1 Tax=Tectimicrobiota bacterium TaxID=2528274 RepID=A0A933GMF7_UNCTE|nr:hypothetical protein [Candidatus Tectomicrobia bacterium]